MTPAAFDAELDEVDALRRRLSCIVFAENWSYGLEPAVHAALVGCYYERFADHAVAIARQVCYLAGEAPDLWSALELGLARRVARGNLTPGPSQNRT